LVSYQRDGSQALAGLSDMLEKAMIFEDDACDICKSNSKSRNEKLLSKKIKRRIDRTASSLEHDERVLTQLLGSFSISYVLALPDTEIGRQDIQERSLLNDEFSNVRKKEEEIPMGRRNKMYRLDSRGKTLNKSDAYASGYDSATQIFAHLTRDWTAEGRPVRRIIYDWCLQQMENHCPKSPPACSVLVPGAGMGRLAYDIFQRGYRVEANELSPSMAAAASSILHKKTSATFHPFVLDGMANEVDSERRFDTLRFPDISIQGNSNGSLSYTVGDFVGNNDFYYQRQRIGYFDFVVSSISSVQERKITLFLFTLNTFPSFSHTR